MLYTVKVASEGSAECSLAQSIQLKHDLDSLEVTVAIEPVDWPVMVVGSVPLYEERTVLPKRPLLADEATEGADVGAT